MMIILAIDSPPTNHLTTQAEERIVLLFSTCICPPKVKGMGMWDIQNLVSGIIYAGSVFHIIRSCDTMQRFDWEWEQRIRQIPFNVVIGRHTMTSKSQCNRFFSRGIVFDIGL